MTDVNYLHVDWSTWQPKQADETETEPELRDVLFALVRLLRPQLVVETGAYKGAMTEALALGCRENCTGHVISCEPNAEYRQEAVIRCQGLPVSIRQLPSAEVPELEQADFLFLDSDYKYRVDEIRRAKKGATIVVHDAFKSYDPKVRPLAPLIQRLGGICWPCGIDGRGFGIMVK